MTSRTTDRRTRECSLSDGRTIAYTTSGDADGFPVVVHHGTPGSRLFAAILSEFASAEGVRLVVPDRPGYGRSSPPPRGWTWKDWRDDLTELAAAESIDRAGIVGFSGGGPFALAAASSDWASGLGLVSSVVPPAQNGLVRLSKIPFALRVLFRVSNAFASLTGPDVVVGQYTDRTVSEPVANAVADDFHEALRLGSKAVSRETKLFANSPPELERVDVPVRAWHGTRDENTPLAPVRRVVQDIDGTLVTSDTDHLGTLLDCGPDVFRWLSGG